MPQHCKKVFSEPRSWLRISLFNLILNKEILQCLNPLPHTSAMPFHQERRPKKLSYLCCAPSSRARSSSQDPARTFVCIIALYPHNLHFFGVLVLLWLCFVSWWLCGCGGVFAFVFFWWFKSVFVVVLLCFCGIVVLWWGGCVFVIVILWWRGCVFEVVWLCFCGGVVVFFCRCVCVVVFFLLLYFCGDGGFFFVFVMMWSFFGTELCFFFLF